MSPIEEWTLLGSWMTPEHSHDWLTNTQSDTDQPDDRMQTGLRCEDSEAVEHDRYANDREHQSQDHEESMTLKMKYPKLFLSSSEWIIREGVNDY